MVFLSVVKQLRLVVTGVVDSYFTQLWMSVVWKQVLHNTEEDHETWSKVFGKTNLWLCWKSITIQQTCWYSLLLGQRIPTAIVKSTEAVSYLVSLVVKALSASIVIGWERLFYWKIDCSWQIFFQFGLFTFRLSIKSYI